MILTMWDSRKGNPGDREKISGEMTRQSTGDIEGSDIILYDTAMADICDYAFVQTHRMNNTKSEP